MTMVRRASVGRNRAAAAERGREYQNHGKCGNSLHSDGLWAPYSKHSQCFLTRLLQATRSNYSYLTLLVGNCTTMLTLTWYKKKTSHSFPFQCWWISCHMITHSFIMERRSFCIKRIFYVCLQVYWVYYICDAIRTFQLAFGDNIS